MGLCWGGRGRGIRSRFQIYLETDKRFADGLVKRGKREREGSRLAPRFLSWSNRFDQVWITAMAEMGEEAGGGDWNQELCLKILSLKCLSDSKWRCYESETQAHFSGHQQIGGLKDSRLDEVMVETMHTETHPEAPTFRVWDKKVNAAEETERRQLV